MGSGGTNGSSGNGSQNQQTGSDQTTQNGIGSQEGSNNQLNTPGASSNGSGSNGSESNGSGSNGSGSNGSETQNGGGSNTKGSGSSTNPSNGSFGSSGAGGQGSANGSELESGSGSNNQNFGPSDQLSGSSTTEDAISASGSSSSNGEDDDRVDIPSDANAGSTQKYKVLPGSLYQCPKPGFYPYEANCREFYVCLEVLPGILFAEQLYRCPSRYLFDEDTRRCQREEKVNCRKFAFNAAAADFAKENVLVVLERFLEPFFATPLNYRAAQTIYPRG